MSGIITLASSGARALELVELRRVGRQEPRDDGLDEVGGEIRVDEHHTCHARIGRRDEPGQEASVGVRDEDDRPGQIHRVERARERGRLVADPVLAARRRIAPAQPRTVVDEGAHPVPPTHLRLDRRPDGRVVSATRLEDDRRASRRPPPTSTGAARRRRRAPASLSHSATRPRGAADSAAGRRRARRARPRGAAPATCRRSSSSCGSSEPVSRVSTSAPFASRRSTTARATSSKLADEATASPSARPR